jgi:hypothetical protein
MTEEKEEFKLPANLEELYAKQIDFCRKIFEECEEVQPMWVGQSADNEVYPVTAVFNSFEEKEATAMALKEIFERFNVVRYVSMLESWMVVADAKTYDPNTEMRPSQHPNRTEVIIISGEDGENEIFGYFKIIREDGKKPTLSKFERKNGEGFSSKGLFSELLPRRNAGKPTSIH